MGAITSSIGLASGIDTGSIIEQLIQLERRPIQTLQARIAKGAQVQVALTELSTRLNSLKSSGTDLRKPSTFEQVAATSGDENALKVTAGVGAPPGRYSVEVRSLVQAQQTVTNGFASKDENVGAGTLTLEVGGGQLTREARLDTLNGGRGVTAGSFRVTDALGRSGVVDTQGMLTLEEVAEAINLSADFDVEAVVRNDRLELADRSGGAGAMRVRDLGEGTTAADLRLTADAGATVGSASIVGGDLNDLARETRLDTLNDGRGVDLAADSALRVTDRRGDSYDVDLSLATTVGDVIDTFNAATGGAVTLAIGGQGLRLENTVGGPPLNSLRVESLNGTSVAEQLGLAVDVAADTADGRSLLAELGGVLTSSLRGGQGIDGGTIRITDRAGNTKDIDADVDHLGQVLDAINDDPDLEVTAALNDAGNGIVLRDTSGGAGTLAISDVTGSAAAQLGIAGTHAGLTEIDGGSLQHAWVSRNSSLATYDVGQTVGDGTFTITDSAGATASVNLAVGTFNDLGDVIDEINNLGIGVAARVNDNGDGLLVEDTAGGAGEMSIVDDEGSSAEALRIAGTFAAGVADGTFEATIDVLATDSLEEVRDKINELGYGARATLINDGSGEAPWRLSLSARDAGVAGGFVLDAGATGLSGRTIARARDASVFVGGGGGLPPLVVTSASNTIEDVVPGVTLDLRGTTRGRQVEVNVSRDNEPLLEDVNKMVEAFNALRDSIDKNSSFNAETNKRGLLLGEPAVARVERDVYGSLRRTFDTGDTRYRILADVGIRIADGAKLELDEAAFRDALADNPGAVKEMFTAFNDDNVGVGFGHVLQKAVETLTDPVDGVVTRASDRIDESNEALEDRIARIEDQVAEKEAALQRQFLDMELALSELQFQQQQLSAIPSFRATPSNNNGGNS